MDIIVGPENSVLPLGSVHALLAPKARRPVIMLSPNARDAQQSLSDATTLRIRVNPEEGEGLSKILSHPLSQG